jgi:hypothetical protein
VRVGYEEAVSEEAEAKDGFQGEYIGLWLLWSPFCPEFWTGLGTGLSRALLTTRACCALRFGPN